MNKALTIFIIITIIGAILFLIGFAIDSGSGNYEIRTYENWKGENVSYLTEETGTLSVVGVAMLIIGGFGVYTTKKSIK